MKIMIVDDSSVYRMAIQKALQEVESVNVGYRAANGSLAVEYLKKYDDIDLITLDMEMPVMDGIETIKEIRKFNKKVIIICFSTLTMAGAEKTIEALSLGANDYAAKVSESSAEDGIKAIREELIYKIKTFVKDKDLSAKVDKKKIKAPNRKNKSIHLPPKAIAIGCSTGGPEALRNIFSMLPESYRPNVPMFIVQHMPPMFTAQLAKKLDSLVGFTVKEAEQGEKVVAGVCYIAPGDWHMKVVAEGPVLKIALNQDEKVCYVRPAVDVLFDSVADLYKDRLLSIVLTGMGSDGANGAKKIRECGGEVYVQDEETSIVWGMPRSTIEANVEPEVLPLEDFPALLQKSIG